MTFSMRALRSLSFTRLLSCLQMETSGETRATTALLWSTYCFASLLTLLYVDVI